MNNIMIYDFQYYAHYNDIRSKYHQKIKRNMIVWWPPDSRTEY